MGLLDDATRKRATVWVAILTFSAGFTNAEATIGSTFAVSHQTGNVTQLAIAIKDGSWTLFAIYLALIACFFIGSVIAGALFYQCEIGRSKQYGLFSLTQGIIYVALSLIVPLSWNLALYLFAALSLGVQNGILKSFRGITSRTTHMTGYLTDAGVVVGERLRGKRGDTWKSWYFLLHVGIFIVGTLAGAILRPMLLRYTVTVAGVIQMICGVVYLGYVNTSEKRHIH